MKKVRQIAKERLGYESLRPDQERVVELLLGGQDVLAIMPTGGGKSAIYQLAGVVLGGSTIVVSPLIALQADQVDHIDESDLPPAAVLNSHTSAGDRRKIFDDLAAGKLEYLLLAPEQLLNAETLAELRVHRPGLFVVDEAHCVSEWGHDFRPDYRRLGKAVEELGHPRVLALTATASPTVREDILRQLGIEKAAIHVAGFDRPNIDLRVEICPDVEIKDKLLPIRIRDLVAELNSGEEGHGIVYVATHANTELVAALLKENNLRCTTYHGGMSKAERNERMAEFMESRVPIMVATSAFGMGVDKASVRWVIHYDVPDSLDNYFQQIGRAGRDGDPAIALLLYREQDLGLQKSLSSPAKLEPEKVADVVETLRKQKGEVDLEAISEQTEVTNGKLDRTLQLLEAAGAVEITLEDEIRVTDKTTHVSDLADHVVEQQDRFRDWRGSRLEQMRGYALTDACRRYTILHYFGQPGAEHCEGCDNCRIGRSKRATAKNPSRKRTDPNHPWPVNGPVKHKTLGRGIVQGYEGTNVSILFEQSGKKDISVDFAKKNKLIRKSE